MCLFYFSSLKHFKSEKSVLNNVEAQSKAFKDEKENKHILKGLK